MDADFTSTGKETRAANFDTLNGWRKAYIVFNWIVCGVYTLMLFNAGDTIGAFLVVVSIGFAYWVHVSIAKRKLNHITAIAVLTLFPGLNILGCLILVWIRQVTKKEIEQYNLVDV